jgi:autotransporter-associated beta strand protein
LNGSFTTAPAVSVAGGGTFAGTGTVGAITVANGGTLDGGYGGSGTLTAGNVTLGASASDIVTLKGTLSAGNNSLSVANLTINGGNQSVILNAVGAGLVSGTYYDLLVSNNPITAPNAGSVLAALKSNSRAYTPAVSGNKIQLYYDANASIYWTGVNGSAWNATTTNWKLSGNNTATQFLANDVVYFRDGAGVSTVDISDADVNPVSTNFTNSATNYVLQGSQGIASGSLTKSGSGTLTISNANSYSGGTTLSAGTLNLSNAAAIGVGTLTINGGTLDNTSAGPITLAANNAQTWSGNFAFGGTQALNLGTGSVTLTASPTVTVNGSGANGVLTVGGVISGSGFGLTKAGPGTLVLSGANTYSGNTVVSAGTLQLTGASAAGSGAITLGDANTGGAPVQLILGNTAADTGFNGNITVSSSGAGPATINVADIGIGTSGTGTITLNSAATIDGSAITSSYYQSKRALAGSGTLTYSGAPGKRFILGAASSNFTGDIVVQSGIFEPRDTLSAPNGNNVTVNSGAELRIQFAATSINGLNGTGLVQSVSSAQTLTLGIGNGSGDFGGTMQSVLSLIKEGLGTQVLSGTNTYTGTTTVNAGALVISGSSTSPTTVNNGNLIVRGTLSGSTTINSGGLLKGTGTLNSAILVNPGGTLSPGENGLGVMNLGSDLDVEGQLSLVLGGTISSQYEHVQLSSTGKLTLGGNLQLSLAYNPAIGDTFYIMAGAGLINGQFSNAVDQGNGTALLTSGGYQFLLSYTANSTIGGADGFHSADNPGTDVALQVIAVPEPGAWVSLLGGCGVLLGLRRRRN